MPLWVRDSARDDLEVYGAQPSYAKLAARSVPSQVGEAESEAIFY
jgi:hypothetical protein